MLARHASRIVVSVAAALMLSACSSGESTPPSPIPSQAAAIQAPAQTSVPAPTSGPLNPAAGRDIGKTYEAFLSPHQEPGEEKDTPSFTPDEFRSTAPSLLRQDRTSRGHGQVRFTRDFSRAFVDVRIEGVKAEDINMFHIHCGRPDMLGPILIDFAFSTDLQADLADGMMSVELTNVDIEKESAAGKGLVGAFTAGCPVVPGVPGDVKTIAGMHHIAQQGELYFNLHTTGQTFYGDIRGQLHLIEP